MRMTYQDFTTCAFSQWFGVQEVDRIPPPTGSLAAEAERFAAKHRIRMSAGLVVTCKPGGYQDHIDLKFTLDEEETITSAELILDRAWMEDPSTAPFAVDIAKSFVLTFAGEDEAMQTLGRQLELSMGGLPGVLSAAHVTDPVPPDPHHVVTPALDVYAGRAAGATLQSRLHRLVLANVDAPQGRRLSIEWVPTPSSAGSGGVLRGIARRIRGSSSAH